MLELITCLEELDRNEDIRAVIIASTGSVFSSGHDLSEDDWSHSGRVHAAVRRLLAADDEDSVDPAAGDRRSTGNRNRGGMSAGCVLRSRHRLRKRVFATPGVRIGLFCTTPMVALSRAIGRKRALEMLLTGEMIDAETAAEWGLINRAVPASDAAGGNPKACRQHRKRKSVNGGNRQARLVRPDRSGSARSLRVRNRL